MVGPSGCFAGLSGARTPTRKPAGLFACLRGQGGSPGGEEAGERGAHERGDHRTDIGVRCEMMMLLQDEGSLALGTPYRGGAASVFQATPTRHETKAAMRRLFAEPPALKAAEEVGMTPRNLEPGLHAVMPDGLQADGALGQSVSEHACPPASAACKTSPGAGRPSSSPEWVQVRKKILGRGKSEPFNDDGVASPHCVESPALDDSGIEIPLVATHEETADTAGQSPAAARENACGGKPVQLVGPIDDDEASGRATPTANSGRCSPRLVARQASSEVPLLRHGHPLHWAVKQGLAPSYCPTFDARPEPPPPRRVNWGDAHERLMLETAERLAVAPPYRAQQRVEAPRCAPAGLAAGWGGQHDTFERENPHSHGAVRGAAPSASSLPAARSAHGGFHGCAMPESVSETCAVPFISPPTPPPLSVPEAKAKTSFQRLRNTPRGTVKVVAAEKVTVGRAQDTAPRRILMESAVYC
eukprot:Tamp_14646.p1 GENE.Tamp_14646~~Tamp_14646.p1  ORF type:complete len:472 (-),score=53.10 Tamp_14646:128-1543(-)